MTSVLVGRKFWNGLWLPRRRWPNYSPSVDLVIREWHVVATKTEWIGQSCYDHRPFGIGFSAIF